MGFDINKEKIHLNKNGVEVDCDVLFTFDSDDTMKSYIGYTDNCSDNEGRKNIYVSSYNPFSLEMNLENINDENELKMIAEVLQQFDKEVNE